MAVGATIMNVFNSMVKAGLKYGYITAGSCFVFKKIDWSGNSTDLFFKSAIMHVVGFTVMVTKSNGEWPPPSQDEQQKAVEELQRWPHMPSSDTEMPSTIQESAQKEEESIRSGKRKSDVVAQHLTVSKKQKQEDGDPGEEE
ncbi:hypothetical protein B0H63DRAFT_520428 [Podospora didyma]|uniref:Uncharacterized protein n=1 Tax=Podospora didyma TaxID=330526 RepID=A0AAE0U5D5_9PEZI|nr:hypothetical protein B0H63DRAFT_520428 [Podospora didyma]